MKVRTRYQLAVALGLWTATLTPAQEPGRLQLGPAVAMPPAVSANQQLAERIAHALRQGGQLRNYRIDVACSGGVVELVGVVTDQTQRDEALRLVQGVPGVDLVRNNLTLVPGPAVVRTQAAQPDLALPPAEPRPLDPRPAAALEPMPLAAGPLPGGGQFDVNPPRMPPFAWPSYSPYPNFSRVAYPEAYPYNAWPYIGPVYPFPKVPLGWRSVKLEFEDGYWWFSRVANKKDWWRLKYW